jgi:hypothetical protein
MASGTVAALAFSCDNGMAPTPDAGDDTGTDATPAVFTYSPMGCGYVITPGNVGLTPGAGSFQNLALDDTAAPTGSITPSLVRVGVGGGSDNSKPAAYANPRTNAAFTWETPTATNAAKVKYGTSPTSLTTVQTGYSWQTPRGLGSSVTNMHSVHVCGLTAGTTYYYQVGGGPTGSETWSATQSFTTIPELASGGDGGGSPLLVGILGDARDTLSTWQLVQERMLNLGVAMQLIPGDIVDIGSNGDLWTQWLTSIWQDSAHPGQFITLGQQLIMPIAGNHESEATQFYGSWAIPGDDMYASTHDSFDVGNTHFVMIDDQWSQLQTDFTQAPASTILAWLDADLNRANMNRSAVPFIVVLHHRGIFSTCNHATDGDVLAARGQLAPIYDKYAVDLVFNGHDHEYERSKPLKAGNPPTGAPVTGSGTTYVICAGAGADPYSIGTSPATYSQLAVCFSCSGNSFIGTYSTLSMSANTLTLTAYGLEASGTDPVIDTLTLTH